MVSLGGVDAVGECGRRGLDIMDASPRAEEQAGGRQHGKGGRAYRNRWRLEFGILLTSQEWHDHQTGTSKESVNNAWRRWPCGRMWGGVEVGAGAKRTSW